MPFPMNDGGSFSIYHSSLSILKQGASLKILAINPVRSFGDITQIPDDFFSKTEFEHVIIDNRIKPINSLINIFKNKSYFVERFYSVKYRDKLIDILNKQTFDIIQLEHVYLCQYINDIRKFSNAKIVLRPQNIENKIWNEYIKKLRNPFIKRYLSISTKRLEVYEREMANCVDGIITLSHIDAEYFRKYAKNTKIIHSPTGLDFSRYKNIDFDKQYTNFPTVYHLGSMDWRPNIHGVTWFLNKVLPLLIREHYQFKIRLAGKNMPKNFLKLNGSNIIVDELVEDAISYQEDKTILIIPLLSGSGIRIKILEGMAMGKTIISTSIGAQGIAAKHNENILIADTPELFASQIIKCLNSEGFCRKIGKNAKKTAVQEYNLNNTSKEVRNFHDTLLVN